MEKYNLNNYVDYNRKDEIEKEYQEFKESILYFTFKDYSSAHKGQ